jgi:predicted DNA-binding transcriptional regulator AlpA
MQPLLKPEQVAELLQLSLATIYAKANSLGGFYPAGIKALRFRRETIYAIMEGPQNRKVPHSIPASGEEVQQDRVSDTKGRRALASGAADGLGSESPDPSIDADAIRFGICPPGPKDPDGQVPSPGREELSTG